MKNIKLTAVFEPCDEGGYIAYIQEINGINSQGETIEEAKENLTDAVNLMFDEIRSKTSQRSDNSIIENLTISF